MPGGRPARLEVVGSEVLEAHDAEDLSGDEKGGGDGALEEVTDGGPGVHSGGHSGVGVRSLLLKRRASGRGERA